jgi:uncharacterized protein
VSTGLPPTREAPEADPLVSISTWRARPGHEAEFERLADDLMRAAGHFEGHLSGTVLHDDGSPEYHIVHRFRDADGLERWFASPERAALHGELVDVAERVGVPQRITGLETWFLTSGPGHATLKPPPRWKMWLASLAGAYPLVVLFQWQLAPEFEDVPLLLRSAILPLILLSLMTYAVMPMVTRVLARWLYPDRERG